MPQHGRRLHAPFLPHLDQGVLQRKQRRLGVNGLSEQAVLSGRVKQLAKRSVQQVSQGGVALVDRFAEDRLGGVKFVAHAGALGALAGEEKDNLSAGRFHVALHKRPSRAAAATSPGEAGPGGPTARSAPDDGENVPARRWP